MNILETPTNTKPQCKNCVYFAKRYFEDKFINSVCSRETICTDEDDYCEYYYNWQEMREDIHTVYLRLLKEKKEYA